MRIFIVFLVLIFAGSNEVRGSCHNTDSVDRHYIVVHYLGGDSFLKKENYSLFVSLPKNSTKRMLNFAIKKRVDSVIMDIKKRMIGIDFIIVYPTAYCMIKSVYISGDKRRVMARDYPSNAKGRGVK